MIILMDGDVKRWMQVPTGTDEVHVPWATTSSLVQSRYCRTPGAFYYLTPNGVGRLAIFEREP